MLAKRVGYRCSNPTCRQPTSGPHNDLTRAINVGVAAHITAAAFGGPRYDASLSTKQRRSSDNGIWLCQKCAKLIDSDLTRYSLNILRDWKRIAEEIAAYELESDIAQNENPDTSHTLSNNRLDAYKSLYDEVRRASSIIATLFDTDDLSVEDKQAIAFTVGLKIAELTDRQSFYLDHTVIVQAIGAFVGLGDIFIINDPQTHQSEINKFSKNIRNTYRMIESIRDTGKLDPSITSPIVEYFNHCKAIQDKEDQHY